MKPFYVTTPIYYVNDKPHIGTAYSTIAADVIARYQRLRGRPTRFLTGLDEHGLKLERRAREDNLDPKSFVDQMAPPFREAWAELNCSYDDFIRTTESRHQEQVQKLWQRVAAAGDIYLGHYEDWYCVGCEAFYTDKELLPDKICPQHKRPVERIREASYFFRLSKYTDKLLAFYQSHPNFVRPEGRYNEVKSFVSEGLRDLSISRTSFRWGVPVPDDTEHVMYVWFDALTNYISALGGPGDDEPADLYKEYWPQNGEVVHIVGKDILRFHAVYWPAFLMSAGIEPPTQIWAHGWLTVNGEKMSKTLGNFLTPRPLIDAFGVDVLRYYLMREVAFGQDGDFSHKNLLARYNGDLANGLGNLLNRVIATIVKKNLDGKVPPAQPDEACDADRALVESAQRCASEAEKLMDSIAPHRALDAIWEMVGAANKYVDSTAPWNLIKEGKKKRLDQVVYTVLEAIRWISIMTWPFMPAKSDELRGQLGLTAVMPTAGVDLWPSVWGALASGKQTCCNQPLFPRFDKTQEREILTRLGVQVSEAIEAKSKGAVANGTEPQKNQISYDEFAKLELKVATIVSAERIAKSDKLLLLKVDIGESSPRQLLAGIAEYYAPETLIGKKVVVVANLKPRKLMGLESNGMVLAASNEQALYILTVDGELPPGSRVS
ncbi:MAG: methionine--tRNA ligase [Deltaproteobacteria bacterium]|nr:methionine--tRNA ligase [Deltaproteobacteria bacterium]